jgi:Predicted tRNA(5-methylaminomethyl-2-thiouridylate) methyltransferase, contains the PP-loop ATPase domain
VAESIVPLANGWVKVIFDSPQKAVAPGQSVVFYDGNLLIGGGKILRALRSAYGAR